MFDLPLNLAVAAAVAGAPELTAEELTPKTQDPLVNPPAVAEEGGEEGEEEERAWSAAITLGTSVTTGNTDVRSASANATAQRKWADKARLNLNLLWNFQETDDVITQRKLYGAAKYDRFITEKLYWYLQATGDKDEQARVELRATAGPGLGYQFLDTEKWKVAGELGVSYYYEEFTSGVRNEYAAARIAWDWAWTPSDVFRLVQNGQVFPSLEDQDDVYSRLDTSAQVTLTGSLIAALQWVWDWNNTPEEGLERSDNLYLITLGWKY